MTLSPIWKETHSDTFSESVIYHRRSKSCFSLHPSKQQEGRKKSRTSGISIQALYWYTSYILFREPSTGLLMSRCHIKKSILSIDWEFMASKRSEQAMAGAKKSFANIRKWREGGVRFLIVQIAPKKRYWIIFNLLGAMDKPAYRFPSRRLSWSEVYRVIIHVESVTSIDSLPFVAVCIHRFFVANVSRFFSRFGIFFRESSDSRRASNSTLSWQIFDLLVCFSPAILIVVGVALLWLINGLFKIIELFMFLALPPFCTFSTEFGGVCRHLLNQSLYRQYARANGKLGGKRN